MLTFNFDPFPVLTTDRLIMRRITPGDKEAMFELRTDIIVNRYIDRPVMESVEEASGFIEKILDGIKNNDSISWVLTLKDNDRMIGTIDFWRIAREHHRAEIGYVLMPKFHRQGLMQEAMIAALDYGFNQMNLHSVEANINPDNIASMKILEKNGFIREAHFHENFYYNGKFLDSYIYSLLTPLKL